MRIRETASRWKPRVLLWTACYDVENGQAIVTRRVVDRQTRVRWIKAIYKPGGGLASLKALVSAIRTFLLIVLYRPDAIYAVCSRSTGGFLRDLPVLFVSLLGFRVVVHVHGSDLPDLLQRNGVGVLAKALYRRCEILVPSAHLIPILNKLGCKRITLCENFIVEPNSPMTLPKYDGGRIRLLWNSNLMASKGIRECVAGARMARANGAEVKLTVLGRPISDKEASATEMEEFALGLAAESWIDVVGVVSAGQARRLIREHDAVLLPSRNDCQPLAIIEGMAAAREVVIRDIPALRATVGNYPAIVVAGDAKSIAEAIEHLISNSSKRTRALEVGAAEARLRFAHERFDQEIFKILSTAI